MRAVLFALLLLLAGSTVSAADPLSKFDKLPADVEVHMVGVSLPLNSGVTHRDITDWNGLVKALRSKGAVESHIRKLLPKGVDEVLTDEIEMGKLGNGQGASPKGFVTRTFAVVFSQAIRREVLYDKDVFAKLQLTKSLKELVELGDKRTVFQTQRMNRELLSLAFPLFLAEPPAESSTVHVTIKAGKPVVLVTSAYSQTRWVVKVEEGATLAGVIQYGNDAQELTGTDARVIYRAGIRPDGKKGPVNGFNAYKQDDNEPSYKRIKAEVKEITGRDFAGFQGQYEAGPQPFVVTPGAK